MSSSRFLEAASEESTTGVFNWFLLVPIGFEDFILDSFGASYLKVAVSIEFLIRLPKKIIG